LRVSEHLGRHFGLDPKVVFPQPKAVDDFAPEALSPGYKKPAEVHQFFQELGEQRAAS